MIRPVENPEKTNPGDYINRVKQTDPGHAPASRDFARAIEGAGRENPKKRRHWPGFGEDTYESSEHEEPLPPEEQPPVRPPENSPAEDHNLDVRV
ncbi:MAG: hypothetical protein NT025_07635 [bacterium]|nr:hypothetical protein [bacterium]